MAWASRIKVVVVIIVWILPHYHPCFFPIVTLREEAVRELFQILLDAPIDYEIVLLELPSIPSKLFVKSSAVAARSNALDWFILLKCSSFSFKLYHTDSTNDRLPSIEVESRFRERCKKKEKQTITG